MNERVLVNANGETAVQTVTTILTRQGYRVIPIFDLRSAPTAQSGRVCSCYGTLPCTCQFVMLLVCANTGKPMIVIVHGHDAETILRIVDDPFARPDPDLALQVMAAMVEAALSQGVTADGT